MIFPPKRDPLIGLLFLTVILFCAFVMGLITDDILHSGNNGLFFIIFLLLSVIGVLIWIWLDTGYMVNGNELLYRSGPFRGRVPLDKITQITRGQTLLIGLRPALAKKGLIIHQGKWGQVYIAPLGQDEMIAEILRVNSEIVVN